MNKTDRAWAEQMLCQLISVAEDQGKAADKERTERARIRAIATMARAIAKHKPEGEALSAVQSALLAVLAKRGP